MDLALCERLYIIVLIGNFQPYFPYLMMFLSQQWHEHSVHEPSSRSPLRTAGGRGHGYDNLSQL